MRGNHTELTKRKMSLAKKGRKHTEQFKKRLSEIFHKNGKTKSVSIDGVIYISINEAARKFNITPHCVKYRCKSLNFYGWSFVN